VLIEVAGVRILTDPVLFSRVAFLGRVSAEIHATAYADVDVVLISHLHHDHCDIKSLKILDEATVVVPEGAGEYLFRKGVTNLVELPVGQSFRANPTSDKPVIITATFADHDGARSPVGPNAVAIGFTISTEESTVYFAGDTDMFPEMAALPGVGKSGVDIALLPVWGWGPNLGPGHMNPSRAADALELIKPTFAIPIHWGTLFPYGLRRVRPQLSELLVSPPREFAAIATERGIGEQVVVVEPGSIARLGDE